ncbi:MAG: helix-turn-helix domain-containing protein [Planctomycetota bacterium]|jgi:DNA-binding phage protein
MSKRVIPTSISGALRWYIEHAGENPHQIAQRAGVDAGIVYRFVAGERLPNLRTVDKLAKHLGLQLVRED